MGDETTVDPAVTGQQEAAATPETVQPNVQQEAPVQAQPQHDGVQKRIDQLVAQRYEAERRATELQETVTRLLANIDQRIPAAPQVQQDPYEGFDPEDRQRLDRVLAAKTAPLEDRISKLMQYIETQQAVQQVQQVAKTDPPEVAAKAQEFLTAWKSQGKTGWVAEDAITFAYGVLGLPNPRAGGPAKPAQQPRAANGQFQSSGASVIASQSAPPPPVVKQHGVPADILNRPVDEQIEILGRELEGKSF